jgi:putative heme-binding domain-containing protein
MSMNATLIGLGVLITSFTSADERSGQSLEESLLKEPSAALVRGFRQEGDAARGAAVFFQPSLNCARCHVPANGKGDPIGPDLTKLGREVTDIYLIESVLQPSKAVKKGFETVTIGTVDGKTLTGVLAEERGDRLLVRDPAHDGQLVTVLKRDIEQRTDGGPSVMPAGLLNGLTSRQQFLDLMRYLREIADGGPERARALIPDPSQIAGLKVPDYERDIDHGGMIADFSTESLKRGEAIYNRVCVNCHGTKVSPGSLPTSLRFASGQFKNGSDPLSVYRTLTHGFRQMPPQTWMVPSQKYDVIHYLRETFLKTDNPSQYTLVDRAYRDRLPKGTTRGPEPSTIEPWSAMDYGPTLTATYEVSDDASNFAYKGIAVRLDIGPGGVSRGRYWSVFDHDTMQLSASWSGDGFIDWNGINFNGRHEIHPRIVGQLELANPIGPGWADPMTGSFTDPRLRGRDGRPYGPLPRSWSHFVGQYRHGDRVILSYTVGKTAVLEMPGVETRNSDIVFTRTFNIGPREQAMTLQVARRSGQKSRLQIKRLEGDTTRSVALLEPDIPSSQQAAAAHVKLQFDGHTHLELENPKDFDMTRGDYTIAVRFETRRGGSLFCETAPGDKWVPDGKSLFVRGGRLVFDIGWVGALTSERRVDDGRWHVGVLTYERAKGRACLFIDGQRDRQATLQSRGTLAKRVHRVGFTAPDFPEPDTFFRGQIAEIRLYQKALNPDQVAGVMEANGLDAGLAARWKPDEAAGAVVRDMTGHGLDVSVIRKPTALTEDRGVVAGIVPEIQDIYWSCTAEGDLRVSIPAGEKPLRFILKVLRVAGGDGVEALAHSITDGPAIDLSAFTRGGPTRWPEILKSSITPGGEAGAFGVDTLGLPESNPWLCQLRLTGFDFLDGGRQVAVCTWDGDVWLVAGLTSRSGELSWRRIASGLFQPLGLKVRDGNIFVGCRDQIVILRDLNGDGETDFYENFNSDHQVTEHFHEFAMGLQTDAEGNFYYAKAARHGKTAVVPQHGTLLRVSRDGLRTQILATGFRAPNGVCLNGDGTFFLTDQEGFWTPKNRINLVKPGGFYGNMWGYHDVADTSDAAMEPPVCWITNEFDRSPAELLRVPSDSSWGPLRGSLLNLSYGYGEVYVVPYETVSGVMQGGMCALPIPRLPTGVMRGRFHPTDGQLYACGMYAWAGDQTAPGGFYRLRATGKPMHLPTGLAATKRGLQLTFTEPIDRAAASEPSNYSVKTWSIKRTANYGSEHHDEVTLRVTGASLSADGRTVSLVMPEIRPTACMAIKYRLKGLGGEPFEGLIHNTIHRLAD